MLAASPIIVTYMHLMYVVQLTRSILYSFSLVDTQTKQFFIFHLRKYTDVIGKLMIITVLNANILVIFFS